MAPGKRILVIGGSGRTGRLVIQELLHRSHETTALVRKPGPMQPEIDAGLKVIVGTPLNPEDVRKAFTSSNPDVVIVTLSAPRADDSPFAAVVAPPRLMADSVANVISVMKDFQTSKVVVMQAFGVAESWVNMH
jgi:uncharacterized protein YbjT (DUF2867 family)